MVGTSRCLCLAMSVTCAFAAVLTADAGDYLLVKAPQRFADWKDSSFYDVSTGAPSGESTDRIFVTKAVPEIVIGGSDAETLDFLGSISRIVVSNSVFAIDVAAGNVVTFAGSVVDGESFRGLFEKRGDGELRLTAYKKWSASDTTNDYNIDIRVAGGILRLPSADANTYNLYKRITVEAGAKVVSPDRAVWQVRGFAGGGIVTNESGTIVNIYMTEYFGTNKKVDFNGSIGGPLALQFRDNGYVSFASGLNTFTGEVTLGYKNAELRVAKFGDTKDEPSSLGSGKTIAASMMGLNSRLVYIGDGETTHKSLYCYGDGPAIIDGGTKGGLVLAGNFPLWSTIVNTSTQRNLVFAGDNEKECVVAGEFDPNSFSKVKNVTQWHITKRGSGTWRFTADDHLNLDGLFAVENGVLAFDSLAARGVKCALGTSLLTYSAGAEISDATHTPYAFLLGNAADPSEVGFLEYRGAKAAKCVDRPVALAGVGGFRSHVGAGRVVWSDVTTSSSAPGTLVLAGDDENAGNYVCNVTNGAGVVSVRKEGAGTWTMGGTLDFSGGLEVLGGRLVFRTSDEYRYYRLVIKEIGLANEALSNEYASVWTANTWGSISLNDIGLYDADGMRQNLDFAGVANCVDLQPGESAYSMSRPFSAFSEGQILENLYDDLSQATNGQWNGVVIAFDDGKIPRRTDPDHWVSIDMRLRDSAGRICQYDLCSAGAVTGDNGAYGGRTPTAVALYGSTDGVSWDLLRDEFDETVARSSNNYQWLSANYVFRPEMERGGERHTGGWMLKKTTPDAAQINLAGPVTVSNGATLSYDGSTPPTIGHLKLSSSATGTIEGFAFAENGVFEITDYARDVTGIGVNLTGCADLGNILKWTVMVGGKVNPKLRIAVTKDGIAVLRIGTMVVIR